MQRFSDNLVEVTPVLSTDAYADEDILFTTTEIPLAVLPNWGSAILQSITILDKDDKGGAFDIYFMDVSTTIGTINAAENMSDALLAGILTKVSVTAGDYVNLANGQIAIKSAGEKGMGAILVPATRTSTSLYFAGISQDTETYTAAGLVFKFGFLRG